MLQVVPYFMTGFESIGKASEEASTEFQPRRFMLAILLAIVVGALFYATVTTAVAYVAPWQSLVHERFATAVAFEHAMGSQLDREGHHGDGLAFAAEDFQRKLRRRQPAAVWPGPARTRRPAPGPTCIRSIARPQWRLCASAIATAVLMFAGESLLVPITEVGSLASLLGWMASCAALPAHATIVASAKRLQSLALWSPL